MDTFHSIVAVAGLALVTLITRSFFMLPERELPLPDWFRRALRYAPLAALAAVLGPELLMRDRHWVATLADARLLAFVAAAACYAWRRSVLATLVAGMAVYLPLHVGLGW